MGVKYDDMSRSLRVSNRRFKAISGWRPAIANARIGWALLAENSRPSPEAISRGSSRRER